ncbi:MAG: Hsp70 family protein, partial [Planctomycetes bacterium]|nr:Hsp70 family protein [Planctomycetota bacterium]
MAHRRPIIGIDLGTTRSTAAYVGAAGHVTCLPGCDGEVLTPSCVCIGRDGLALIGRRALEAGLRDPQRRVQGFKRHLGEEDWNWCVDGRDFSAVTLSALVLRQLAEDAVRALGPIGGAVITVPAYFGDRQRTATLEAAAGAE